MDFLFIIIRKLLATILPRPKIKIILMSATIDTHAVSQKKKKRDEMQNYKIRMNL